MYVSVKQLILRKKYQMHQIITKQVEWNSPADIRYKLDFLVLI